MNYRHLLGWTFRNNNIKKVSLQCSTWGPALPAGRNLWQKICRGSQCNNRRVGQWISPQEQVRSWVCGSGCPWYNRHHCWPRWIFPTDVQLHHFLWIINPAFWCNLGSKWEELCTKFGLIIHRVKQVYKLCKEWHWHSSYTQPHIHKQPDAPTKNTQIKHATMNKHTQTLGRGTSRLPKQNFKFQLHMKLCL